MEQSMQRTTYRTLTNKELVQLASDHLYEQGTLDAAFSTELLRRLSMQVCSVESGHI